MKHLDESNKMMADDAEMDEEIEKQLEAEARNNIDNENTLKIHEEVKFKEFSKIYDKLIKNKLYLFDLVRNRTHQNVAQTIVVAA